MDASPSVSAIVPTHNPHAGRLKQTLQALATQTLPSSGWELIVVDNRSADPSVFPSVFSSAGIDSLRNARVVREERLGLTYARLAGLRESRGDLLVLVDDDNVLCADYLEKAVAIAGDRPWLGAFGGKSLPGFESKPEDWLRDFYGCLALRDLGDKPDVYPETPVSKNGFSPSPMAVNEYPACAPIGAGMVLRRAAFEAYARELQSGSKGISDRKGASLASGGDNDLVLTVLRAGWHVGYFPELKLTHLMPASRLTRKYLSRLSHDMRVSWIQVLDKHGICPWPAIPSWSVLPRQIRAYFRTQAWRGGPHYIRWRGVCGHFKGRSQIS